MNSCRGTVLLALVAVLVVSSAACAASGDRVQSSTNATSESGASVLVIDTAAEAPSIDVPTATTIDLSSTTSTSTAALASVPETVAPTAPPAPQTETPTTGAPSIVELARAAVAIFYANASASGDLKIAWQTLTPARQAHFRSFTRFHCIWGQFQQVSINIGDATSVNPDIVAVQLVATYDFVNGGTAVERITNSVVSFGDSMLIDSEDSVRTGGGAHTVPCP